MTVAAAVMVILLIADANGWFKVPTAALTLITAVFLGGVGVLGAGKAIGVGLGTNTNASATSTDTVAQSVRRV